MKKNKTIIFASILLAFMILAAMPNNVDADTTVDAIVVLKPGYSLDKMGNIQYLREYDAINGFSAKMSKSVFNWLKSRPGVVISENGLVHMLEDTLDWGVDDINAEQVWGGAENAVDVVSGNIDGSGVKVCVIDTGIDVDHTDLDANYMGGYDFVNDDSNPNDDNGHGTHCAGIIGAEDNEAGVIGVAPNVDLYACKVLDSSGSGSFDDVVAGINWAVSNGMDVASMSLGASSGSTALQQACLNAYNAGVIVVAAAGNDGGAISYPGAYSSTICVGATDSSHNRASFSNYGSAMDVVAPGVSIYSTYNNGGYTTMSGTSMATPMVAGVVAMILCANPSLSPSEVVEILHTTSTDLGSSGFDIYYGYGLVNVPAAVAAAGGGDDITAPTVSITSPASGATVTGTVTISFSASDANGISSRRILIDGTQVSTASSYSWDTTAYADGSHTIRCEATDPSGNTGYATISVTVDNTENILENGVTVTSSLAAQYATEMWTIQVDSDAESMYSVLTCGSADFDLYGRLGAAPTTSTYDWRGYTSGGEEVTFNNPGAGTWYIMVRSYSGTGAYSLTVTITYPDDDTTAPTVSISSPSNGATVSGTTTISFSASDANGISSRRILIDGTQVSTASSYSWDTTAYTDGSHTIRCEATDPSGNTGYSQISVTVDNSGGDNVLENGVTVTSSLAAQYATEMWTIQVDSDAESMYSVLTCGSVDFDLYGRLGAEPTTSVYDWRGYTGGGEEVTFNNPGAGTWYIMVRSYSGTGAYSLTVTITYPEDDTTAPTVTINSPTNGATVSGTTTISFSASDANGISSRRILIDGTQVSTASSYSWDTTAYTDGSHTIRCEATDPSGNTGYATITVTVDNSGGGEPITYTFTGSVSQGYDSTSHSFAVPSNAVSIEITLSMPSGADFDLSVWDAGNLRTGGWTSSSSSTSYQIANSAYSGYSASPEWVTVDSVASFGDWLVSCYAYSGSGTYTITVTITVA
ncbi:MAG: S8 family serine peptidase [Candidatus Thorarchaeota archaeon]